MPFTLLIMKPEVFDILKKSILKVPLRSSALFPTCNLKMACYKYQNLNQLSKSTACGIEEDKVLLHYSYKGFFSFLP